MSDAMIECDGLTKRFGHFTAVDHVSFSVSRGSIFGFLGPNGSGKSTVIRMLCGILEPTEGTARIGGHDIASESEAIKEMIGYMSQKFSRERIEATPRRVDRDNTSRAISRPPRRSAFGRLAATARHGLRPHA
jgi:ABC-type Mn2+/Zn2+ transport system ATPase subunit